VKGFIKLMVAYLATMHHINIFGNENTMWLIFPNLTWSHLTTKFRSHHNYVLCQTKTAWGCKKGADI